MVFMLFAFNACNQIKPQTETDHEHEEPKFQYTAYSNEYELFAEADAFVAGEVANVLSHFSSVPGFRAVEEGQNTIILTVNGKEIRQTLDKITRKGIYSFDIKPEAAGKGTLKFQIANQTGTFEVVVPEITVFSNHDEAHQAAEKNVVSRTNTAVFTKEQSWKIDFTTGLPLIKSFGQVIKTTGLIKPAIGDEMMVTAQMSGVIKLTANEISEGLNVKNGQQILSISATSLAENNMGVKYAEARNNYERAKADYERTKELAAQKIVSEKDLLAAKNNYENAAAVYNNLNSNFNTGGQMVKSPINGFIRKLFVENGSFVEAGSPLFSVSQNKTLLISANVQQKYLPELGSINNANFKTPDGSLFQMDQLNGRILAFGKSANTDNYLIPLTIQVDNKGTLVPGSFVEIYLKTETNQNALVAPNSALLEDQGNFYVWVQINPELFEKREVKIGNTDGYETEILKGIAQTDRIVTSGAIMIKLAQSTGTLDAHSGHVH